MSRVGQVIGFITLTVLFYCTSFVVLTRLTLGNEQAIYCIADYYKHRGGNSWQRFNDFHRRTYFDAIVIGSSHAYRGYDPGVFEKHGYSVFNLGSSAQTPLNSFQLIKSFLDSTSTRLLIMDIYEGTLQNDGLESTMDLVQNQPSLSATFGMVWNLRDLRGINAIAQRLLSPRSSSYPLDPNYLGRGFAPHTDSIKTAAGMPTGKRITINVRQGYFLAKIMTLCKDCGISVVLSSHYARANRRGSYHAPLVHYIKNEFLRSDVSYLDFTEAPGIDDLNWFADNNHLNAAGARIFTEQLVDSLETLGYLKRAKP